MRFSSVTLLICASIAAGCADPSLAARTAARAEAWRRAWREQDAAALARAGHRPPARAGSPPGIVKITLTT